LIPGVSQPLAPPGAGMKNRPMKLAPAAEFAVRGVLLLAERYGQGPIPLRTICNERDLPKEYLSKIFASLARAGLVEPVRGKHGGYVLGREPEEINVLEVIEAVGGPIALNLCQHTPPRCDDERCHLRKVWGRLQKIFCETLAGVSLADCVAGSK